MDLDVARDFLSQHHRAVMLTYRAAGSPQLSPVACGVDGDGRVVVSTRQTAMKAKNLRRDPRVSLCVFVEGFYGPWIQVDGSATVISLPDAMEALVDYYRSVAGEHPNWAEYRHAMEQEQRVIVQIELTHAGPDVSG